MPIALASLPFTATIDLVRIVRFQQQKGTGIPPDLLPEATHVTQKFYNFELLIKIVKLENWAQFLAQLADYEFRPALRASKPGFWHMTPEGQIISPLPKKTAPGAHRATKKTSTTLIGPNYAKPFGSAQQSRTLVGVLFDRQLTTIKRMYTQDIGTVGKPWQGTEAELHYYWQQNRRFEHSNLDTFIEAVRCSNKTNEVLAELTRESVLGIVIGRNDESTLVQAQYYLQSLSSLLNRQLNIYWYDSEGATLSLVELPASKARLSPV